MKNRVCILFILAAALLATACKKKVPDLVGLTQEEATKTLEDSGLKVGTVTLVSGKGKAGSIVDQEPKKGTNAEKGGAVALVVEKGGASGTTGAGGTGTTGSTGQNTGGGTAADFVPVPDVLGKTVEQAEAALTAAGLGRGTTLVEITSQPAGQVFKTSPVKGTQVAPGSPVELYVASDSQALVPDVAGKPQGEAEHLLLSAGFTIGTRNNVPEAGPVGMVIRTEPGPGAGAPRGRPIDIYIRQETVTVPSVVSLKTEPAKLRLYEAGLVPVVRTERAPVGTPPTDLDVVIAQLQDAGKRVGKGSEVALVVRSNVTRPWIRFERTGAMVAVSGAQLSNLSVMRARDVPPMESVPRTAPK